MPPHRAELGFNVVFTIEMLLRIVAVGGPLQYVKRAWNVFDGAMVLVGYTAFIPSSGGSSQGVRALRALRALRPLRTITRFEALRAIIICFMEVRACVRTAGGAWVVMSHGGVGGAEVWRVR